jgi:membrane protein implicated in regulation of membrane protease activity
MTVSRPRFLRPVAVWIIGLGGFVVLVARGLWPIAAAVVTFFVVVFGGAWLLSPWSRTARNLVLPDRATFERRVDRSRRFADAIGRIPIFGAFWRFCQRLTRSTVDNGIARQREIIDEEARRHEGE